MVISQDNTIEVLRGAAIFAHSPPWHDQLLNRLQTHVKSETAAGSKAALLPLIKQVLPQLVPPMVQVTQGGREWRPKPRLPSRIWAQAPQAASMPLMTWLMATTSSPTASEPFCIILFHFIIYSLGCTASRDSSDILA